MTNGFVAGIGLPGQNIVFSFFTEGYDFNQGDFISGNGLIFTTFFLHHEGSGTYPKGAGDNAFFRQIVNGNLKTLQSSGVVDVTATAASLTIMLSLDKPAIEPFSLSCPSFFDYDRNVTTATAQLRDSTGQPHTGQLIRFGAQPIDLLTSGHDHASNPTNLQAAPSGFFLGSVIPSSPQSCTTGFDGSCQLSYASEISGTFKLVAVLGNCPVVR